MKYQVGDRVRVRHSAHGICSVVEYRGPLGPGGTRVYRLRSRNGDYVEVREDQLIPAEKETEKPLADAFEEFLERAVGGDLSGDDPDDLALLLLLRAAWAGGLIAIRGEPSPQDVDLLGQLLRERAKVKRLEAGLAKVRRALSEPGPEDEELTVDVDDFPLF